MDDVAAEGGVVGGELGEGDVAVGEQPNAVTNAKTLISTHRRGQTFIRISLLSKSVRRGGH
jgi:hypothetical protein